MIIGTTRGRFPRGPHNETPEAKRLRYEKWLIETRNAALVAIAETTGREQHLDPEYDAVMRQPGRTEGVSRPSVKQAIRARCWQCEAGDGDEGGTARIGDCAATDCALWSVRPYQGDAKVARLKRIDVDLSGLHRNDHAGKALANPGNMRMAVRGYCQQCAGGQVDVLTQREVHNCLVAHCALWRVRAGAKQIGSGIEPCLADGDDQ